MSSARTPIGELISLAAADDLDGVQDETKVLDLTGAAGAIIIQQLAGTLGTAGVDVVVFSRDGGANYALATAANIGNGHPGLMLEDGTAAAAAGAALNASAGVEGNFVCSLGPVDGPFQIKVMRDTSAGFGTDWVTGAPAVVALRIG
jgi:hypothetical protein